MTGSTPDSAQQQFIWATRGRSWGFRFLRNGGYLDPLPEYETAFASIAGEHEAWCRVRDRVAVRFPDPEGRRDEAGGTIQHDLVLMGPFADRVDSVGSAIELIWPILAGEFALVWDETDPPQMPEGL